MPTDEVYDNSAMGGDDVLSKWYTAGIPIATGGSISTLTQIASAATLMVVSRVATFDAGETHLGEIGGNAAILSASPLLCTASPYAAGYLAGTGGILEFASAGRVAGGTGELKNVTIVDKAKLGCALELVLFSNTTASTTFTDNAAFDVDDIDLAKICGVVAASAFEIINFNDNAVHVARDLGIVYDTPAASTSLYGALVTRSAASFVTANDVSVHLGVARN